VCSASPGADAIALAMRRVRRAEIHSWSLASSFSLATLR
jgi:hypothetical protein